jgi:hypothetical protein
LHKYKNVFDSEEEFNQLKSSILEGIKKFSDYRNGNLTYGEIMYVLECILDELRDTSEKKAKKLRIYGLNEAVNFSTLIGISSRIVERFVKKGILSSQDEAFILHGEE